MRLDPAQRAAYRERGYHCPLRAFGEGEAQSLLERFHEYRRSVQDRTAPLLPRERGPYFVETHLFLRWVYGIVTHPRILDAVEDVLGPDILVWSSQWFAKLPHDRTFVSWHQDATYWGLSPPNVTTAWVALSPSNHANGCVRVIPGSHLEGLPQRETWSEDNLLSRGQEIAVEVDEARAVEFVLAPGEFSLHHIGIVHGSLANESDVARVGLAIRYISPDVVQQNGDRDIVLMVRGADRHGHFDLGQPPDQDMAYGESEVHRESMARKVRNLMAGADAGRESAR